MKTSLFSHLAFWLMLVSSLHAATLPGIQQLAPGVHACGFPARQKVINTGWIALTNRTLLVDLPSGIDAASYLSAVRSSGALTPFEVLLTRSTGVHDLQRYLDHGVNRILCTPAMHDRLEDLNISLPGDQLRLLREASSVGDATQAVDYLPFPGVLRDGAAAVHLPKQGLLFAGALVCHGPRTELKDCDSAAWIEALHSLEALAPRQVVPGRGSSGSASILLRQRRFLSELRRQVGQFIALGHGPEDLHRVQLPADYLVWMPYDTPKQEDLLQLYQEMTVPRAPFGDEVPDAASALVLIGDGPHEPGRIERGLRPIFAARGIRPFFTVDVRAIHSANLAQVPLLVIFRDGHHHGGRVWMTPEQEKAIVSFVENGGGFLNLHNSLGLYPEDGPYLQLVGGRYAGHGPLEEFEVDVVDPDHPVTRGVKAFRVADEQHTPPYDADRCHLLLRNRSDDGMAVAAAGWVREPGKGRVCYLANGHTRESLAHPMVQQLFGNAMEWLIRRPPPHH